MSVIPKNPPHRQYPLPVDNWFAEEFFLGAKEILTLKEFFRVTGIYHNFLFFKLLEIKPDTLLGDFAAERLPELQQFCTENPDFHIMCNVGPGILLNTCWPNAVSYGLGDGDKDPWVYYICKL